MNLAAQRPYCTSLLAVIAAWVLGVAAMDQAFRLSLFSVSDSLFWTPAIGSLVIAIAAGLPGLLGELTQRGESSQPGITVGFSVGGIIRLFGTVALVALCRYQMPAATKESAFLILGWYCYLTVTDVSVLAKLFPLQDSWKSSKSATADDVTLSSCPRH